MSLGPWRDLARLPRPVWVLALAILVNRAGSMVMPFLVLYLTRALHFGPKLASGMLALYGGTSLLASPVSGWLSDKLGAVKVMVCSLAGSGLALLLYPFAHTPATVALATICYSVTAEMFRPASLAMTSLAVPEELRRPAFSLSRLANNLGVSIGPAVGGFLAAVSFRWLFLVDGVSSLAGGAVLVLAFLFFAREPRGSSEEIRAAAGEGLTHGALRDPLLALALLAMVPVGIVFFQLESAMPLYMVRDLHLTESTFGLMFTVNTLLIVAIEVPLNVAMARWPHRLALPLGAFLCGAGFGGLALVHDALGVALTVVLWTFGEMILFPGMSALVADLSSPARRGEYMGLYTMSFGLCFSLGPWLGTVVLDHLGPAVLWPSCLVGGILSAVLLAVMPSRRGARTEPATA